MKKTIEGTITDLLCDGPSTVTERTNGEPTHTLWQYEYLPFRERQPGWGTNPMTFTGREEHQQTGV